MATPTGLYIIHTVWLLSHYEGRVTQQGLYTLQSLKYLVWPIPHKFADWPSLYIPFLYTWDEASSPTVVTYLLISTISSPCFTPLLVFPGITPPPQIHYLCL